MEKPLTESQLAKLAGALHAGAAQASHSMETWLSVPSVVEIDSVDQLPIVEATELLGGSNEALCFCSMEMTGTLTGQIMLAFDDVSGWSLTDLLLDQSIGTASNWGDVEKSAALETMNILGCAYLNELAKQLNKDSSEQLELIPTPPQFRREFAESLLEAAFMGQAISSDFMFVARTEFQIRGQSLDWTLLFIPDGLSLDRLRESLSAED